MLYSYKGGVEDGHFAIRQGTKLIVGGAFWGCTSLKSIDLPNSVTKIGNVAFSNTVIEMIIFPSSLRTIGEAALGDCPKLSVIKVDKDNPIYFSQDNVLYKKDNGGDILIKYSPQKDDTVFSVSKSTIKISSYAFARAEKLTEISLHDGISSLGESDIFYGCSALTHISLPNSVTKIGWNAFEGCTSLKSIDLPDSATKIGDWAFEYCISLKSINLPDSVTEIGDFAFRGCKSLENIDLPGSVTEIGDWAFYRCTSLQEVLLPNSEKYEIKEGAFVNCTSLKSIHSAARNIDGIKMDADAFDGRMFEECTLYVPAGTRWAYRHHPGFGQFRNIEIE